MMLNQVRVGLLVSVCLSGCGGGASPVTPSPSPTRPTTPTPSPQIVASGENWSFRFNGLTGAGITGGSANGAPLGALEGSFDATGNSITAVMQPFGSCLSGDTMRLYFTGSRTGPSITLTTQAPGGETVTINATLSGSGETVQGTYSMSGGCSAGASGAMTGQRVNLSGLWRGTMGNIPIEMDLEMATTPDADGPNYVLSGPVRFSDTQCFPTAVITRRGRGRVLFPDIVGPTQRLELIAEVDEHLSTIYFTSVLVTGTCPELSFTSGRLVRQ
jgi:hypothetical protein